MKAIQTPITGNESSGNPDSPYQALVQFYKAFNTRDLDLMAQNWANSHDIAMSDPLGRIKRGWEEIQPLYARIFGGKAEVYVEYHDYTIHESNDVFYAVGRERGYFRTSETEIPLAIRTSRIFQKIDGQWRQVHHHGSIEDPALLDRYQRSVVAQPV